MTVQESRERNWLRYRIVGLGFNYNNSTFITDKEKDLIHQIMLARNTLLDKWDENSVKLGVKLKPFRCSWCGKRANRQHIYGGENFCLKDYKKMVADYGQDNRVPTPTSSMDNSVVCNVDGNITTGNSDYSDNGF